MSVRQLSIEVCQRSEAHANAILSMANDSDVFRPGTAPPLKFDDFWPEYSSTYFTQATLPPLFIRDEERRLAFLRFQTRRAPDGDRGLAADLTIALASEAAQPEITAEAIALGVDFIRQIAAIDCVVADIGADDDLRRRALTATGFRAVAGASSGYARFLRDLTPRFWRKDGVTVIAEAGSNWRMGTPARDMAMARTLIDCAVDAGADAVKFQTYRPETVYVETAGASEYLADKGVKEDIRDIFADLAMPYEMVGALAAYCDEKNIAFMSSPFSPDDFAAIDPFVGAHKIASYEISHMRLIDLAAGSGKPLVLSTGASVEADIAWAVDRFHASGGRDLCLLQCTAKYPAPMDGMNLRSIPWLKRRFGVAVGLSDHSRHPLHAPIAAVAAGATVIEKHYTVDNRLPGPDHSFALTPNELRMMVDGVRDAERSLGDGVKTVLDCEGELAAFARRGVQAIRPIAPGDTLTEGENFSILRPGRQPLGVHPRYIDEIEGARAVRALALGEGLQAGDWTA